MCSQLNSDKIDFLLDGLSPQEYYVKLLNTIEDLHINNISIEYRAVYVDFNTKDRKCIFDYNDFIEMLEYDCTLDIYSGEGNDYTDIEGLAYAIIDDEYYS